MGAEVSVHTFWLTNKFLKAYRQKTARRPAVGEQVLLGAPKYQVVLKRSVWIHLSSGGTLKAQPRASSICVWSLHLEMQAPRPLNQQLWVAQHQLTKPSR